jgi:hypothetical protein
MRKLAGLALVGAVAVATGAVLASGGLDRAATLVGDSGPKPNAAASTCFDYNGPLLPGLSRPWLQPLLLASVPGVPDAFGESSCLPGTYLYDDRHTDDSDGLFHLSGVPLGADGCPIDVLDIYRRLMAVHPMMGGSVGHRLTDHELELLGIDLYDPNYYADATIRARSAWNAAGLLEGGSMDDLLTWYRSLDVHRLPPIPDAIAKGLGEAPCTAISSQTPTAAPTPAPTGETRRYRITVNGYENALPWPVPDGPVREGVRFDYRLIGEFVLERPAASKPWTVASRRVVTADLGYSSLYPADRCQVTPKCENRFCRRLDEASTLRLRVTVDGDEIVVSWGAFAPSVLAAGTCTDASIVTGISYGSDDFQKQIAGERLPLRDLYVGPQTIRRYEGRAFVKTSFAYRLEQLP